MKNPFNKTSKTANSTFLCELTDKPIYFHYEPGSNLKTTFTIVFDAGTQLCYSSVKLVAYFKPSLNYLSRFGEVRQLGPFTLNVRDHAYHASPGNPVELPSLTVPFEAIRLNGCIHIFEPVLQRQYYDNKSVYVLLECEHSLSPDTISVSVDMRHAFILNTSKCCFPESGYMTGRTIRVVPMNNARPRISVCSLPVEVLLRIFKAATVDQIEWQNDLLSFAQVCFRWSCSLRIFFARLETSRWETNLGSAENLDLDPCVFANALRNTPALGLMMQHLQLDQHQCGPRYDCRCSHLAREISPGFTESAITILRASKNLQHLDLSQGYSPKANALFSALPELQNLRTLSITRTQCVAKRLPSIKYWNYTVSMSQLARCMARWSSLTSLTVEHIKPGSTCMERIFFQQPTCALVHLCLRKAHISDKDLFYLTASSVCTLSQVTLDGVYGLTHDGLLTFLMAISATVTSLTIHDVVPSSHEKGWIEHPLDLAVNKMWCLRVLSIRGDVASKHMLYRRSKMFVRSERGFMPIIQLFLCSVPKIRKNEVGSEWPGWRVV